MTDETRLFSPPRRALETLFCIWLFLALSATGLSGLWVQHGLRLAEDPAFRRTLLLAVQGPTLLLLAALSARHWRDLVALVRRAPLLVGLLALVALSAAWSLEPARSLAEAVRQGGLFLAAAYVAVRYREGAIRVLWLALAAALLVSVTMVLLVPEVAVHIGEHDGAWKGGYPSKNPLGMVAVLMVVVSVALLAERFRWELVFGLLLGGLCLFKSRSMGSVLSLGVGFGALGYLLLLRRLYRARPGKLVPAAGIGVVALALAAVLAFWPRVEIALSRDATMSSRYQILEQARPAPPGTALARAWLQGLLAHRGRQAHPLPRKRGRQRRRHGLLPQRLPGGDAGAGALGGRGPAGPGAPLAVEIRRVRLEGPAGVLHVHARGHGARRQPDRGVVPARDWRQRLPVDGLPGVGLRREPRCPARTGATDSARAAVTDCDVWRGLRGLNGFPDKAGRVRVSSPLALGLGLLPWILLG
ncbi:MAG: hypothetical protein QM765_30935 [Myxococcales bacterium]